VTSKDTREVELKYAVDDEAAVRTLLDANTIAGFTAGPWKVIPLSDRYLDTASRALERAGYGARLRHVGRKTLLTVKTIGSSGNGAGTAHVRGARHDRLELESVANQRLDPQGWPQSAARSIVETAAGGEHLRTLFTITQRRNERELLLDDGSVLAVLSLDEAEVSRFGRALGSFTVLEVELANSDGEGSSAALDEIADLLEATGLLRPETSSKEELGMALVHAHSRQGIKPPKRAGVTGDDPLAEAGRKVLRMHLLRMLEAEDGSRDGEVESVHKMRVATRRMRAAWRVFNGAYRNKTQKRYVAELREVAQTLGAVRDMDVQLQRLAEYSKGRTEATLAGLSPLVEEWQRRRDLARDILLELFASADYDHFVTDYLDFVETPEAGAATDSPGLVRDAAAGRIWRAYERLRAHNELVPFADVPALHALRIESKRLRYTLEFFAEVLPPSAGSLIAELTAVQDHLGLLNDAHVSANLTREWLMSHAAQLPPDTRRAAGAYLTASERDMERLRRSFTRLWVRVMGRTFRRRLALAIGEI
jgi:CHAD domain-containing protein